MSSIGQRYHRAKLAKLISKTSLHDIVGMSWCAWALQNGHADAVNRYMRYPPEAANGDAGAPLAIYTWLLETLVNEAMVMPHIADPRGRQLITQEFSAILNLTRATRRIEEADDRVFLADNDVLYEMHRLTQRQFEWQRGFANQPRYYRALCLFADGASGAHFAAKFGCTVPEFIEAAFLIFVGSSNSATRRWDKYPAYEGISVELRRQVLNHISVTAAAAQEIAKVLRAGGSHIAYKPSVLRQYPILRFGHDGSDAMAPLPPLILQRVTSGIYFDVIDGGGAIREDIGRNFETYCRRYIDAMLPEHAVDPEFRYGSRSRGFDSPDILVSEGGAVRLVVECKAKRMPIEARLSGDPVNAAADAYMEIAKGIFQVWRFFSHARRGSVDRPLSPNCIGIVLTADPWLVMGQKLYSEVMSIAHRLADEKDPDITHTDRRRVPIVLVDDLEYFLQHAPASTLFERLAALVEDTTGWAWSLMHGLPEAEEKEYPFTSELSSRLPRIFGRDQVAK